MARVDEFDAFYHAARRPLLHQTYALTGDARRAATSVEHAFAHAWSEWRKVRHLPDPEAWVRDDAWRVAGSRLPRRRGPGRRRLVGHPVDSAHRQGLEALRALPDGQRRAVVLHHLAELPVDRIAGELGISESAAASLLTKGEQAWADAGTSIGTVLAGLDEDVAGVRLTRAPSLRRSGEKRHRRQTLVGVATAAALTVGGGLLIANDTPASMEQAAADAVPSQAPAVRPAESSAPPSSPEPFLLDHGALLTPSQMSGLTRPAREWSVTATTDGTTGDPIYAPCQREPFADPDGNQSLLRHYRSEDRDTDLSAVQVVEESRSERESAEAFTTMEDWYARCDDGVQLLSTMAVRGLGDEARAFRLRDIGKQDTQLTVGIVRTGPITTAVIASARASEPVPAQRVLDRAAATVTRVCLPVSGDCSARPRVREVAPLPAEEHPGFLSAFDLPKIRRVSAPWVGTDPARSPNDHSATPCERAHFRRAQQPRTRVFVLPTAKKVPRRFGLAETVGTFGSRADARAFLRRSFASADNCPERELSAEQPRSRDIPGGHSGRIWRFEFEVNENNSVFYRVGLVRSGRRVALLSMSPSTAYDVRPPEFTRLMVRAGQRLAEAGAPRDASPASPTPTPGKPTRR